MKRKRFFPSVSLKTLRLWSQHDTFISDVERERIKEEIAEREKESGK